MKENYSFTQYLWYSDNYLYIVRSAMMVLALSLYQVIMFHLIKIKTNFPTFNLFLGSNSYFLSVISFCIGIFIILTLIFLGYSFYNYKNHKEVGQNLSDTSDQEKKSIIDFLIPSERNLGYYMTLAGMFFVFIILVVLLIFGELGKFFELFLELIPAIIVIGYLLGKRYLEKVNFHSTLPNFYKIIRLILESLVLILSLLYLDLVVLGPF